ncbi:Glycosyl phosphatidyl inositol anchor synthesis [Salix suchowensis]|nr:Glycosyl phosphatidyl inositol anchor synthesis [Salix suchowensis]
MPGGVLIVAFGIAPWYYRFTEVAGKSRALTTLVRFIRFSNDPCAEHMYPSTDLVGDDGSSDVADLWFNLFKPKQDFPSSTNISDGSYCASALASTTQLRQNNCALVASPLLAIVLGAKSDNALEKTTAYLIGFGVWFVVLSVNAEGLFYLAYAMTLQIWIEVETNLRNEQHVASSGEYRSLRLDDTRIAVFFLFFVQFAFFGAGKSGNNIQAFPCIRLLVKILFEYCVD